jgi:hypothetical protein
MHTFFRELTLLAAVTAAGAFALLRALSAGGTDHGSWMPVDNAPGNLGSHAACARRAALLGSTPLFEFQVDHQARFLGARGRPRLPAIVAPGQRALVHFVVDTAGRVVLPSFRVLHVTGDSAGVAVAIRSAAGQWRYSPAMVAGCRTPQIVQTIVERASRPAAELAVAPDERDL